MTNVAWYSDRADMEDCIRDGTHLTNCDDEGYCNHCGCKDGIEDLPVQCTFGPIVGLPLTVSIAPHSADEFRCEDTGKYHRRNECLFSYDGKAWEGHNERYCYEVAALVALVESLEEDCEDRIDHDDSIDDAQHSAFNDDLTWREYVADYYHDDCIYCDSFTDDELQSICDELMDRANTMVKRTGYGDFDYDLTSWDVGEVHEQIMINDHLLLKALHGRGKLEDMLDIEDGEHRFVGHKCEFVYGGKHPCLDLMIISDKTYWWGCTHETMEEVYHEIVGCDD